MSWAATGIALLITLVLWELWARWRNRSSRRMRLEIRIRRVSTLRPKGSENGEEKASET